VKSAGKINKKLVKNAESIIVMQAVKSKMSKKGGTMKKFLLWSLTLLLGVTLCGCFEESASNTAAADAAIRSLNQAHKTNSSNNLQQIGMACRMFVDDNDRFPNGLSELLESNSGLKSVLIASYDKKSSAAAGSTVKSGNTSYAYLARGISGRVNADLPVCIEKPWLLPPEENTIRVLFASGEVKVLSVPNVSGKSCEDVVDSILSDSPDAGKIRQNASRIDRNHKKNK